MADENFSLAETGGVDIATAMQPSNAVPSVSYGIPYRPALPPIIDTGTGIPAGINPPPQSPLNPDGSINVNSFVGQSLQQYRAFAQPYVGFGSGGGAALSTATDATNAIITAKGQLNAIQAAQEERVKRDDASVAARFGYTPGAPNMTVAAISDSINVSEQNVLALQEKVRKEASIDFLSDPIGWLTSRFTLPKDISALSRERGNIGTQLEVLKGITTTIDDQHKINEMLEQDTSQAKLTAQNLLAYGLAKDNLSKSQFEAARLNQGDAQIRLATNQNMWNASVTADELANKSTANSIAIANMKLEQQKVDLTQDQVKQRDVTLMLEADQNRRANELHQSQLEINMLSSQSAQEREVAKQLQQGRLDKVTIAYNLTRLTPELFAAMPEGPMKQFINTQMANPNVVENGRYGADIVQSMDVLSKINLPQIPGVEELKLKYAAIENKTIMDEGGPISWKMIPPEIQHLKLLNAYIKELNSEKLEVKPTGSIFSPPPLSKTLAIPAIFNTTIGKSLMPLSTTQQNTYNTDPQDFAAAAVNLISQGKITREQAAAELAGIFKSIQVDMNQRLPFQKFGHDGLNSSTGYNMRVNTGGFLSSSRVINTESSAAWGATLDRMTAALGAATFIGTGSP